MGDSSIAALDTDMAAPSKIEEPADAGDRTPTSIESTPELEALPADAQSEQSATLPQKRKGGRKPIYATSEERKQRNRQAQAAFRERRTEYIKQLEATIKQNDETLATLQQSHRSAADECLMLRYKNSLLERILLEKGIDVQSELQMKTGSPTFGPDFMHPGAGVPQISQPQPPLQRTAIQRQHARRSGQNFINKDSGMSSASPQGHPTPPSHASSPTTMSHRSPVTMQQQQQQPGGVTPPTSSLLTQPHQRQFSFARSQQQPSSQPSQTSSNQQQSPRAYRYSTVRQPVSSAGIPNQTMNSLHNFGQPTNGGNSSYYSDPFQKHIDQLEQEYDAQQHCSSLLEQADADLANTHSDPDQSNAPFDEQQHPEQQQSQSQMQAPPGSNEYYQHPKAGVGQQQLTPSTQYSQVSQSHAPTSTQPGVGSRGSADFQAMAQLIDPDDPMLDADPFGLSASMHYPTAYSFDQIPQR